MNNVKPINRHTPEAIAAATAKAEAERKELHENGKREGLKHAQRYRDYAMAGIGLVVGLMLGMLIAASLIKDAAFNAGAVADRVLARTVEPVVLPPAPEARSADEYNSNAEDARAQACRDGIRRACRPGVEPRSAE